MEKMIKKFMCGFVGVFTILGSGVSLHADEIKTEQNLVEQNKPVEISPEEMMRNLVSQMEKINSDLNDREISRRHDLEIQLSEAVYRVRTAEKEYEQASWYKRISAGKKLEQEKQNELKVSSDIKENESAIVELKNRYKNLTVDYNRLYMSNR